MFTSTLENILNRGLPRSPRARELCTELTGRRVAVEVRGIADFTIASDGNALTVSSGATDGADARVRAGATAFLKFAAPAPPATLRAAGIDVEGDEALAERYRELGLLLRPDLEEELALAIGDVPAHEIARVARAAFGWCRSAAETTVRNFAEYFAHERGDLVSRSEGRQLFEGIGEAHAGIERIEARIALLEQRLASERRESRAP
ncbi:MAG: ubiquinone biosynthesis accessory factor UbiJ [Steroidobacteraceae bacterium]